MDFLSSNIWVQWPWSQRNCSPLQIKMTLFVFIKAFSPAFTNLGLFQVHSSMHGWEISIENYSPTLGYSSQCSLFRCRKRKSFKTQNWGKAGRSWTGKVRVLGLGKNSLFVETNPKTSEPVLFYNCRYRCSKRRRGAWGGILHLLTANIWVGETRYCRGTDSIVCFVGRICSQLFGICLR